MSPSERYQKQTTLVFLLEFAKFFFLKILAEHSRFLCCGHHQLLEFEVVVVFVSYEAAKAHLAFAATGSAKATGGARVQASHEPHSTGVASGITLHSTGMDITQEANEGAPFVTPRTVFGLRVSWVERSSE